MKNLRRQYKIGTIMIWLGVLVWAPYFGLRLAGGSPNLLAYLPFHLLGVLGGAKLRADARKKLGIPKPIKKGYQRVSHWLVVGSVLVWFLYYALKLSGRAVDITPFLNTHLITMFSGTGLMATGKILDYLQNKSERAINDIGYSKEKAR